MPFEINPDSIRPFYDPEYQAPSVDDIRLLLKFNEWTGSKAARIVGVDNRTLRRWTGGERPIPYSAWRLLLVYSGLVDK